MSALYLDGNYISKIGSLGCLSSLQRLHLSRNNISELANLDKLHLLQELNLSENNLTDLQGLAAPRLTSLDIAGDPVGIRW